jgi:hypothetical protein
VLKILSLVQLRQALGDRFNLLAMTAEHDVLQEMLKAQVALIESTEVKIDHKDPHKTVSEMDTQRQVVQFLNLMVMQIDQIKKDSIEARKKTS